MTHILEKIFNDFRLTLDEKYKLTIPSNASSKFD